jgi:hypothetical protein
MKLMFYERQHLQAIRKYLKIQISGDSLIFEFLRNLLTTMVYGP